jgi:hypothetical protein
VQNDDRDGEGLEGDQPAAGRNVQASRQAVTNAGQVVNGV